MKNQVTFSLDHKVFSKLNASWRISYQDRKGEYPDINKIVVSYKPFMLVDARLYWKEKHYLVYVEATNLFDVKYYDFGGIAQPYSWVRGGVTLDF